MYRLFILVILLLGLACTSEQDIGSRDGGPTRAPEGGAMMGIGGEDEGSPGDGPSVIMRPDPATDPGQAQLHGEYQPLSPRNGGITISDYGYTAVTVTDAAGHLGCALVGSESASPGTEAAVVVAKIDSGQDCPVGVHPIMNDPERCSNLLEPGGGLRRGCAAYRRWDAAGNEVAFVLATGGYVAITSSDVECTVELSAHFGPGQTVQDTVELDYPTPTSTHCEN